MSVRPTVQHLVDTRFSIRTALAAKFLSRDWLEERLELLDRFCLASIAAQTCDEFTWLVLCDESTDAEVLAALRERERSTEPMRILITGKDLPPRTAVREVIDPGADVLITTRLDSDDAIRDSYVEAVQAYAESFHNSANAEVLVNFRLGYRFDVEGGRLYDAEMPNSPFHSLFERPRGRSPETVMRAVSGNENYAASFGSHEQLHLHCVTHQDVSVPGWLQSVHGGNLKNTILESDRERPAGEAPAGFSAKLA